MQPGSACVVHVKHHEYDVYIGRRATRAGLPQSKWHNPYVIGRDGTLEQVLQKFEKFYLNNFDLRSQISELSGKRIACWCCGKNEVLTAADPIKCHGQILLKDLRGDYMAQKMKAISDEVIQVLANLEIDGQNVRILDNLSTKLYPKVKEALLSIGGRWQTKIKAHVFPEGSDPQALIDGLLGSEKLPARNPLAFFATSQPLALRMIALLAQYAPQAINGTLLDPEAGEGGIADEIPSTAKLILVELDQSRVEVLQKKGYQPIHADFLTLEVPSILVDGVLMNPPFTIDGKTTAYIDHIKRASLWVKDGGAICAIAPSSFGFATDAKTEAFRAHVESLGEWESLEDGSFKDSGTNVSAVMLTYRVRKPTSQLQDTPLEVGDRVIHRDHPYAMDDWTIASILGFEAMCDRPADRPHKFKFQLSELERYTEAKAFPRWKEGDWVELKPEHRCSNHLPGQTFQVRCQFGNGMVSLLDGKTEEEYSYFCDQLQAIEQSQEKMVKAIASGIFQTPAGDIAIQVFRGVDDALRFQFRGALIDPATYPHGEMIQWLSPIDLEDSDNFPEDETAITQYANFLAQENAYHFLMELDDLSAKLRQSLRRSLKDVSNPKATLGLMFNRFFNRGDAATVAELTLERLRADRCHSEAFRVLALRLAALDELIDLGVNVAAGVLWNLPDGQKDVSQIAAAVQVGAEIGKTTLNGQEGVLFSVNSTMPSPNWSASGERLRAPQAVQGVLFQC